MRFPVLTVEQFQSELEIELKKRVKGQITVLTRIDLDEQVLYIKIQNGDFNFVQEIKQLGYKLYNGLSPVTIANVFIENYNHEILTGGEKTCLQNG